VHFAPTNAHFAVTVADDPAIAGGVLEKRAIVQSFIQAGKRSILFQTPGSRNAAPAPESEPLPLNEKSAAPCQAMSGRRRYYDV
jgi:hypothetical protein